MLDQTLVEVETHVGNEIDEALIKNFGLSLSLSQKSQLVEKNFGWILLGFLFSNSIV